AAVEIQMGPARRLGEAVMQRLARVLFHVHARDADGHGAALGRERYGPPRRQRAVVLRDLVTLGKVGIEVVLPREDRVGMDLTAERERGACGELDGAPVEDR